MGKGISGFDWENSGPSAEALEAFTRAIDEEFPHSYSGQAWRAAYRLWLAVKDKSPEEIDKAVKDPYGYDPSWNWCGENGEDLGLSGFMAGWAMNAVRQMMKLKPIPNGAVVTIGTDKQPPLPATGPAEGMMRRAIGGD